MHSQFILIVALNFVWYTLATQWSNIDVDRAVDLSSHIVKVSATIKIKNDASATQYQYGVVIDPELKDKLAYISATCKERREDHPLKVSRSKVSQYDYDVELPPGVKSGDTHLIQVDTWFSHALEAFPKEISQEANQLVRFHGNRHFYSTYQTISEKTTVSFPNPRVESHTEAKPATLKEKTLTYGPHNNVKPLSQVEFVVHYENNRPALTVRSMTRSIEISNWGNLAVEEEVEIHHTGAVLKGSFSRFDYQRRQGDSGASVRSFRSILPATAKDIYYRDAIGNISTSNVFKQADSVELELTPRFPLFGGWKTVYKIGYNVPVYQYLFTRGDRFVLKMRAVDHVYDDFVVDDLTLRIVLPEGSSDIEFDAPYDMKREKDEVMKTYLDTVGRTVIVVKKGNLVEGHIQDFADESADARARVASTIDEVASNQDSRVALYQSFDDAIAKFKSSKDSASFQATRKQIEASQRTLNDQLKAMQQQVKPLGPPGVELTEKIVQLQAIDSEVRELITQAVTLAERLIAEKLNKQAYIDQEGTNRQKRTGLVGKAEGLVAVL